MKLKWVYYLESLSGLCDLEDFFKVTVYGIVTVSSLML